MAPPGAPAAARAGVLAAARRALAEREPLSVWERLAGHRGLRLGWVTSLGLVLLLHALLSLSNAALPPLPDRGGGISADATWARPQLPLIAPLRPLGFQ